MNETMSLRTLSAQCAHWAPLPKGEDTHALPLGELSAKLTERVIIH